MAMDELERAMLDRRVNPACSSHIFLHVMPELEAVPKQIVEEWKTVSSRPWEQHRVVEQGQDGDGLRWSFEPLVQRGFFCQCFYDVTRV